METTDLYTVHCLGIDDTIPSNLTSDTATIDQWKERLALEYPEVEILFVYYDEVWNQINPVGSDFDEPFAHVVIDGEERAIGCWCEGASMIELMKKE